MKRTRATIHFLAYNPKKGRRKELTNPIASVNSKAGRLTIGSRTIKQLGMNGKLIKFFYEPVKRIIGWRLSNQSSLDSIKRDSWKMVKTDHRGIYMVSVRGMLNDMKFLSKSKNWSNLEIHKYRNYQDLLDNEEYYYIKLD